MRSEEAASEVIGMVLILSIMIASIGIIMLVGVPMINSAKEQSRAQAALNSFDVLQTDIEEVVRGPMNFTAPARITEISLGEGALAVEAGTGIFNVSDDSALIASVNPGRISYKTGPMTVAYESGAVIMQYQAGGPSTMTAKPLFEIYNASTKISIVLNLIKISGTNSSKGGGGRAEVKTKHMGFNPTQPSTGNITISITSEYPDAWEKYFSEKLMGESADFNITKNPPNLSIKINNTDIYLYETKIDVQVS